ncbi:transporter substrate-binding domain-containing protein [Alcaligenaceae bacterium CGII-47]|nr:transporter substrate-binding domain-containing protein [Alcaligenaceae bacterium CGII-47]
MLRSTSEIAQNLAPHGVLRVALNFGNAGLVRMDPHTQELSGVSVDLSRELARELEINLEFICFDAAREVVGAVAQDKWDVAFLAISPARLERLQFTQPYAAMAGSYMVRDASPIHAPEDVDQPGVRIASALGAAYDLYLSDHLKHARLVRAQTTPDAVELFVNEQLDAVASVRAYLSTWMLTHPGYRILDRSFTTIEQAMATPKGRTLGWTYLASYIQRMKACNFVAQSLARSDHSDLLALI